MVKNNPSIIFVFVESIICDTNSDEVNAWHEKTASIVQV